MRHPGRNEILFDVSIQPTKVPSKRLKGQNVVTVLQIHFQRWVVNFVRTLPDLKNILKLTFPDFRSPHKLKLVTLSLVQVLNSSQTLFLLMRQEPGSPMGKCLFPSLTRETPDEMMALQLAVCEWDTITDTPWEPLCP